MTREDGVDRRLRVVGAQRDDGILRLWVTGDLDILGVARFRERLSVLLAPPVRRVELDLRGVTFCGAAGVGELLRLRRRAVAGEFDVVLVAVSDPVRFVLGLCGAGDWLP
ncbi:STAS domain-containing protein [Actinoplanes awajinensis]|uniref:STAS domain-containing protein n=1 Tax=Actinoplanes awajinensis TaxID=135946 RepID=UPI000A017B48|nr:STAS domain-containing protein [Actinoplanes awajinensis]